MCDGFAVGNEAVKPSNTASWFRSICDELFRRRFVAAATSGGVSGRDADHEGVDPERRRLLAGLATATAAGLAGCGGDGGEEAETAATADGTAPTADGTAPPETQTATPRSVEFAPFWTTGEKVGVATAVGEGDGGRVWYTLTRGALTELRYPRIDLPNVRRIDFLVTDGDGGYAARTADLDPRADDDVTRSVTATAATAPAYEQTFTGETRDWELTVASAPDPARDAVAVDVTFDAAAALDCYVVCRPAVALGTTGDTAARRSVDAEAVLTAADEGDGGVVRDETGAGYDAAVALAADPGFAWASAAPVPDPATADLLRAGVAPAESGDAAGNAALVGRLAGDTTLAVGFGETTDAATDAARDTLADGVDAVDERFRAGWTAFHADTEPPDSVADDPALASLYRRSLTVLRTAEDDGFHGAGVASPSIPWGDVVLAEEPDDVGYHFVWGRDLYQSFTAWLAAGRRDRARAAVEYLFAYQRREGGFLPQNTFLDGRTRWGGEQLDQIAFPLVMVRQLIDGALADAELDVDYPAVAASADYVLRSGPETEQERWEEESGLSPSTIAAEVAGLVSAADLAADAGEPADRLVWLATADQFRAGVREWVVTREGTDRHDPPYYYRIGGNRLPDDGTEITLANGGRTFDERNVVDAGFLELVRLGVYPADDPVIESSVGVVDDAIRVETPHGPGFYRYTGDGYGEGVDGAPYPVVAETVGRLWPLLTAERAEYELAAGTETGPSRPARLLATLAGFANDGGLLPEQVWDREAPTAYDWTFGEGTGSATPLSWSHAAFVRLAEELDAGEPARPAVVADRYDGGPPAPPRLSVSLPAATVESTTVTVTGETDAPAVAVAVDDDARLVPVEDGAFEATLSLSDGRNTVVVAAGDPDADTAETAVAGERTTVSVV